MEEIGLNQCLKVLSYNVCGLKSKVSDVSFFDLINKYDIIILLETFVSEQEKDFIVSRFVNFKLKFEFAVRHAKFGRAVGGKVLCINLQSIFAQVLKFTEVQNFNVIEVGGSVQYYSCLILPVYLNYNFWDNDYQRLYSFVVEHFNKNLIIMGDLNGRIAAEQGIPDLDDSCNGVICFGSRKTKDSVINNKGRKILEMCENYGFIVLNGRTVGDGEGEFTFINARGASVIDLAMVSVNCLHLVRDFRVISRADSDHMPIELWLKVRGGRLRKGGRLRSLCYRS